MILLSEIYLSRIIHPNVCGELRRAFEGPQRGFHAEEGRLGQHPNHDDHQRWGKLDHVHQDHHEER